MTEQPTANVDRPDGASTLRRHPSLRRRFLWLLPAVFITYSLAYLDRSNFGFGAAAGLAESLKINGAQLSLLSAIFFVGYLLFQLPGAILARRFGVGRLVFCSLLSWGVLASLTGVIRQFWLLAADRFLIGVAESIVFPVTMFLLTRWFTRSERSRANTFLILGNPLTVLWMSALTGFFIDAVGWQKTFVFEGLPSVLWAFVWLLLVPDRPRDASWLTPESVTALEAELKLEQAVFVRPEGWRKRLLEKDVLLLALQYFCWSMGVYGFVLWLPTIVRQALVSGTTLPRHMSTVGLLTALPYLLAVASMLVVSYVADRRMQRVQLVWPCLLLGGVSLMTSVLVSGRSVAAAFACLVIAAAGMYAPYGPYFAMIPERISTNAVGEAMAVINSCGALGGFVGSYLVGLLQWATGGPKAGLLLLAAAVTASSLLLFLLPPVIKPQPVEAPCRTT